MTKLILGLALLSWGLQMGCSPKPPPVRSVKDLRSEEAAKQVDSQKPASLPGRQVQVNDKEPASEPNIQEQAQQRVYNSVLARGSSDIDVAQLQASIEARTGAKVKEIKKGALGLLKIKFEQSDPPRNAEEQKKLVEALKDLEGLKSVEPERLVFPKAK